jgi:phospholipase A1
MTPYLKPSLARSPARSGPALTPSLAFAALLTTLLPMSLAQAQSSPPPLPLSSATGVPLRSSAQGWQVCQTQKSNPAAQLACFQAWADVQAVAASALPAQAPTVTTADASDATGQADIPVLILPAVNTEAPDGQPIGCKNLKYSPLSRFWELQRGTDCDTFTVRGFRPLSLAVATGSNVNRQPTSGNTLNNGTLAQGFSKTDAKIALSVRTKIAKGLLKSDEADESDHDSLWFAYSQKSYWQVFNKALSRPFRSTDFEPEAIYIYPHQIALPGGWNYRLTGAGVVHQSNGQSLPLSRSWNRAYLFGAAEKSLGGDAHLTLQAKVWRRFKESAMDDDNPGIENFIGRGEFSADWQINPRNSLGVTVKHALRKEARGSTRVDWMLAPNASPSYSGLRYHVQLFNGYGDNLLDYNKRRTVLSLGISLVDW